MRVALVLALSAAVGHSLSMTHGACTLLTASSGNGPYEAYQGVITAEDCYTACTSNPQPPLFEAHGIKYLSNGMTIDGGCYFGTGATCSCYCNYGSTGTGVVPNPSYSSCLLPTPATMGPTPLPTPAPFAAWACNLVMGVGIKPYENYQGTMSAEVCLSTCMTNPTPPNVVAHGITYVPTGMTIDAACDFGNGVSTCQCYCDYGSTGVGPHQSYRSCLFGTKPAAPTSLPTTVVTTQPTEPPTTAPLLTCKQISQLPFLDAKSICNECGKVTYCKAKYKKRKDKCKCKKLKCSKCKNKQACCNDNPEGCLFNPLANPACDSARGR